MKRTIAVIAMMYVMLCWSGASSQPQMIQNELKDLIGDLSKTANQEQVDQIAGAVNSSPRLAKQLADLVSSKKLTQIKVVPQRIWGKPFNAIVDGTTMVFTTDFIKSQFGGRIFDVVYPDDIQPNNLVYCIGHLAYHLNAGSVDMRSFANPMEFSNKMIEIEASASIQGWNDVVDAAVVTNAQKNLSARQAGQLLMNLRYRSAFLKALKEQPALQTLNSGFIESNQSNISAITAALKSSSLTDME